MPERPFAGPEQVLRYLSRYTHRVAISPRRLRKLDTAAGKVEFAYKMRRDPESPLWTTMELALSEFVRRYCLHILPERFVKIRHYGLLANRGRHQRVAQARALLHAGRPAQSQEAASISRRSPQARARIRRDWCVRTAENAPWPGWR